MFKQNQSVVCCNDSFEPWVYDIFKQLPKKNNIYTIRGMSSGRTNPKFALDDDANLKMTGAEFEILVLLHELKNPDDPYSCVKQELGFRHDRFAPLVDTEESIDESAFVPDDFELIPS